MVRWASSMTNTLGSAVASTNLQTILNGVLRPIGFTFKRVVLTDGFLVKAQHQKQVRLNYCWRYSISVRTSNLALGGGLAATSGTFTGANTNAATYATFQRSDDAVSSRIRYDGSTTILFGTSTNHPISFETNATPRLTISNDGKVGIGNPNPSTILSLGGSLATGGIYINSGVDEDHTIIDMTGITGGGKLIWDDSEEAFSMSKGLRVTAGKVGIGTASPGGLLDLATTGGTAKPDALRISNAANASYYWDIWRDNTTGYLNFGSVSGASLVTSLVIKDVTGYVGIGTTAPSDLLHLDSSGTR